LGSGHREYANPLPVLVTSPIGVVVFPNYSQRHPVG
jgi:hypothetical protein